MPRLRTAAQTLTGLALCLAGSVTTSHAQTYTGVNLSGLEFNAGKIPGRYGWDYISPKDQEFDYYASKGVNIYRIPTLWERLQPTLNGPLDPAAVGRIQHLVDVAHAHGGHILLDIHDYGNFRGQLIGTDQVPSAAFADLWSKLASAFKGQPVMFGLMNEPKVHDANAWASTEQQAIDAIRKTGAKNPIFVSGIGWDGAHSFMKVNAAALAPLHDPDHSLVYEVHQYFDSNYSGTKPNCIGPDQVLPQLQSFTDWLKTRHAHGFLGEFGVSADPTCLKDLGIALDYIHHNTHDWTGWTYWAGGPLWGHYMFSVEPDKTTGAEKPQMSVLAPYFHPSK